MEEDIIFRVPSCDILRIRLFALASKKITVVSASLMIAVGLLLSLVDLRYAIATLMILMIILPGAVALAIFYLLLSPQAVKANIPHRINFFENQIEIRYVGNEDFGHRLPPDEMISFDEITKIDQNGKYLILYGAKKNEISVIAPRQLACRLPERVKERLSTFE